MAVGSVPASGSNASSTQTDQGAVASFDKAVTFNPNPQNGYTIPSQNSNYSTQSTGGLWADDISDPTKASTIGAGAIVQHPDLELESTDAASKLINGSKWQDIAAPSDGTSVTDRQNTLEDAYEKLGISNRQIALYEKAYATGTEPLSSADAHKLLTDALQMRAAIDKDSNLTLLSYDGSSLNMPIAANNYSLSGAVQATVQAASDTNKYWSPGQAVRNLLFNDGNAVFSAQDLSLGLWVSRGQSLLSTAKVSTFSRPGAALSEKVGYSAQTLAGLSGPWTSKTAAEAFYSANALMQGIEPEVDAKLSALTNGQNQTAAYQTGPDQAALYRQAVDAVLSDHGFPNLKAQDIGQTLLDAYSSAAYSNSGADQSSTNTNLAVMSFFDPEAVQHAGLLEKYADPPSGTVSTPAETVQRQTFRALLTSTMSAPPPDPNQPMDASTAADSSSVIAQWSIASFRWSVAALSKAKGLVNFQDKIDAFTNAMNSATMTPGSLNTQNWRDDTGRIVATSVDQLQQWAISKAGLSGDPDVLQWLQGAGKSLAATIDRAGIGVIGATASLATRLYRAANPNTYQFDKTTTAQIIASSVADLGVVGEWALSAQRAGPALTRTIVGMENDPVGTLSNLIRWTTPDAASDVGSVVTEHGSVSDAVGGVVLSPTTPVGRFVNWALPQAGGFSNLIYGGFNLGQGIRQISSGKPLTGALTSTSGAIDFFNGLAQLKNAVNPDLGPTWASIHNFGFTYSPALQVMSRLLAAGAGVANAVEAGG